MVRMFQEHLFFDPPEDDSSLLRYMDFAKFVSLLDNQALFFVRADKLSDPYEGAPPDLNIKHWYQQHSGLHKDIFNELNVQTMEFFYKNNRRFSLISCWNESDKDTPALWQEFTQVTYGIAIKTDFQTLKKCFENEDKCSIGRVKYIDYTTDSIPAGNIYYPFMYKRKNFEIEKEVRVIINAWPLGSGYIDATQEICKVGKYYNVDVSVLVKEVIVSPEAENWFVDLVNTMVSRYGLNVPVNQSKLNIKPSILKDNDDGC